MNGISIIVCCYNSAARLGPTIAALKAQKVDGDIPWEILIIDNASRDNTAEVARSILADGLPARGSYRIIHEPEPGLSNARKRGIAEALFGLIIFCDDDNWLDPHYVAKTMRIMNGNPRIGVLGGMGRAVCEVTPQSWFARFEKSYAIGPQSVTSGPMRVGEMIYGAGMVVRRQVLISLYEHGIRSFLVDRKGTQLSSGGDNEWCYWYLFSGYELWYDSALTFQHFVPADRLTEDYMIRRSRAKGQTEAILRLYDAYLHGRASRMIGWWFWHMEIVKRVVLLCLAKFRNNEMLENKLSRATLGSSIRFRLKSHRYLISCYEELIRVFPQKTSLR